MEGKRTIVPHVHRTTMVDEAACIRKTVIGRTFSLFSEPNSVIETWPSGYKPGKGQVSLGFWPVEVTTTAL